MMCFKDNAIRSNIVMKVAIVGAGKLGMKVAEALLGGDHSVTIIDTNEAWTEKINSLLDVMTVNANAKEVKVLKSIDISSYDFLITTTGDDEANIVIAAFAKKLGCSKVIARVRDPEHMQQISFIKDLMNIDYIVNPDLGITVEIYKYLAEKYPESYDHSVPDEAMAFSQAEMHLCWSSMFPKGLSLWVFP